MPPDRESVEIAFKAHISKARLVASPLPDAHRLGTGNGNHRRLRAIRAANDASNKVN
jgi:hypothetical protein